MALFRRWHRLRSDGVNPLPEMAGQAAEVGSLAAFVTDTSAEMAVACDSFFALTEACLGRRLLPGSDAGPLSADDRALLATLRQVPMLQAVAPNRVVPHGLPGALQWAAFAVLRWADVGGAGGAGVPRAGSCPYQSNDSTAEHPVTG